MRNIFCDSDVFSHLGKIAKIALPSSLSALLSNVTYLISFIHASHIAETT